MSAVRAFKNVRVPVIRALDLESRDYKRLILRTNGIQAREESLVDFPHGPRQERSEEFFGRNAEHRHYCKVTERRAGLVRFAKQPRKPAAITASAQFTVKRLQQT